MGIEIDEQEFKRNFFAVAGQEIRDYVKSKVDRIKLLINAIVDQEIKLSPEYRSMLPGGELYPKIGYPNIEDTLSAIIRVINDKQTLINLPIVYSSDDFIIPIEVFVLRIDDYSEILSIPGASYLTNDGKTIPWLEWLLLRGTESVVLGYRYTEREGLQKYSRTGLGVMAKSRSDFSIPGQYAGSSDDNWLIRSINRIDQEIFNIILQGLN